MGSIEQQIEQDVKAALIARDAAKVSTLRGIKSVLLNTKVALGKRETGLTDEEVLPLLAKEAKKRQESADLYVQGGNQEKADAELAEKALIETYLPQQLSEAEVSQLVDEAIAELGSDKSAMGRIIAQVRDKSAGAADGAVIARLVKERLQ